MGGKALKSALAGNLDEAARLLGLEPESDEAAEQIQRLLDEHDEWEKRQLWQATLGANRALTKDGEWWISFSV